MKTIAASIATWMKKVYDERFVRGTLPDGTRVQIARQHPPASFASEQDVFDWFARENERIANAAMAIFFEYVERLNAETPRPMGVEPDSVIDATMKQWILRELTN